MSIFKKVMTALRGGAREVGEAIVDANSTRIFEQEIRDAENHLTKAKRDLTDVMAKQMAAGREVERLRRDISEHEGYASAALAKGDEALALEVAEKIAALEAELSEQQGIHDSFSASADRLKDLIKKTERQLADYQRQLSMVKTTESVQKATAAITDNFTSSNSKLLNAKESLERIKAKQQAFDDRMQAAEQLQAEDSDQSLKAKLEAAGIGPQKASANSVLDRLKAKNNPQG
ncbi:PspA/IM30 family protein [Gallaecimonas sp. GXIMD4217]|uniref:PspA/IM30 family protein n=1 Tax=Gallaecimonas sp. GXIMD4217 TaxID=3131927 RepID=UPI00311AC4F6